MYAPKDARWVNVADPAQSYPRAGRRASASRTTPRIFTDPTIRSGFFSIFIWNIVFAIVSVLSTFLLGMLIALLFNDPRLRGKAIYRSLLILPYALPVFVTALVWKGMFNQDYGIINQTLGLDVDWLGRPAGAKAAILITNLWLGFPYMFIVCTGALQSIPQDVREAATIDGANAFRTLRSIIMPLLLVAVGPLLLASFAFNFNNFGLIYLLTKGGPFNGADTSIGSSDLLITYAYPPGLLRQRAQLRLRRSGVRHHLPARGADEHPGLPSHQGPRGGQLMSTLNAPVPADPRLDSRVELETRTPDAGRPPSARGLGGSRVVASCPGHPRPDRGRSSRSSSSTRPRPTPRARSTPRACWPSGFSTNNFTDLFNDSSRPFWTWYKNSMIISLVGALGAVFIGACAAFAFSRLRFKGRRPGMMFLLLTTFFPALLAIVAMYIIFAGIGDVLPCLRPQHRSPA